MKKNLIFSFLLVIISVFSRCKSSIVINVKHPAQIDIPVDLDTLIIVDRTGIEKGKGRQFASGLESVFSGEPIGGDKYGVNYCKMELVKIISNNERLTLASFEIPELTINNLNEIQKPLLKTEVDSICQQYGADGVLALEFFDSYKVIVNPNMNPNSTVQNQRTAQVSTQWRLYYKETSTIVDFTEFTTRGTHYQAVSGVGTGQYKAIANAGMEAADLYVKRIVPSYYRESRIYFTSGSKELKMAGKAMKNTLWEQAKNYYLMMIDSETDQKILGRACYNLALIFEIEQNFLEAIKYANQAMQAGIKEAPRYVNILRTRLNEQPLIERQMQRK